MTTTRDGRAEAQIEIWVSREGCHVSARIEGAPDRRSRTFVGVHDSREEAIREATGWALGWLRRLQQTGLKGPAETSG
jgi:hypothetical protein